MLSNPQRRREYDALIRTRSSTTAGASSAAFSSTDPSASAAFFEQFDAYFARPAPEAAAGREEAPAAGDQWEDGERPNAQGVFGNVFEELLRPEVQRHVSWWSYIGALSGASLGYILANIPGALAGGLAGNRLGAIRDAKGKSVMTVFAQLEGSQKAEARGLSRAPYVPSDAGLIDIESSCAQGVRIFGLDMIISPFAQYFFCTFLSYVTITPIQPPCKHTNILGHEMCNNSSSACL